MPSTRSNSLPAGDDGTRVARERAAALFAQEHPAAIAALPGWCAPVDPGADPPAPAKVTDPASAGIARIGIWEPHDTPSGVEFRRGLRAGPWRFWANVHIIPPKGPRPRVVLVGESVARGFLCDPHLNVAGALRHLARSKSGREQLEVIDLARNGLPLDQLLTLIESTAPLSPDALVVFAGNNWVGHNWFSAAPGHIAAFDEVPHLLRSSGGWRTVAALAERVVREQVRAVVERIGAFASRHRLPVIVVVPAFNLADWRSPNRHAPVILDRASAAEWHASLAAADTCLADDDVAGADAMAQAMVRIDGGTAPAGFEILAECRRRRGEAGAARELFDRARMALLSMPFTREPSCFRIVQDALREDASRLGLPVVDVPAHLSALSAGAVPDRRWFLDFCHHTVEGLSAVAAAILDRAIDTLDLPEPAAREAPPVAPQGVAESHFAAALFNAAFGQPRAVIQHHCDRAVSAPAMIPRVEAFLEAYVRDAPTTMCGAYQEGVLKDHALPAIEKAVRELQRAGSTNLDLVAGLHDSIARARGCGAQPDPFEVLRGEYGLTEAPASLLERFARQSHVMQVEETWQQKSAFFRAFGPRTTFQFVTRTDDDVEIDLTYRTPRDVPTDRAVRVLVNRQALGVQPASTIWRRARIRIPRHQLRERYNLLTFEWPAGTASADEEIDRIARHLEVAIRSAPDAVAEMLPHWGDLHALTARRLTTSSRA